VRPYGAGVAVAGLDGVHTWDGERWQTLGALPPGRRLNALAVDGDTVYAGGQFHLINGIRTINIAKWNPNLGLWAPVGESGLNGEIRALALVNGTLWAGGELGPHPGVTKERVGVAKLDDGFWVTGGPGAPHNVRAFAVHGGELYACGGGLGSGFVAKLDRGRWTSLGTGFDGPVNSLTVTPAGEVLAAGDFTRAGGVKAVRAARWSREKWSALGSAAPPGELHAITWWNGEVHAAGTLLQLGARRTSSLFRWDGKAWSEVGAPLDGAATDLAPIGDALWLTGAFSHAGDLPTSNVARWTDGAGSAR
jgi:hypothetical protein